MTDSPAHGAHRGRPGFLTKESIIEEALRIPQEEFSMGRLAESLGVSPQALYHYFPSKHSISIAIARKINQMVPLSDRSLPWREYTRSVLLGYREFLQKNHYPFARVLPSGVSLFRIGGDASGDFDGLMMSRLNDFMTVFLREGLTPEECMESWFMIQNFLRRSDLHRATQEMLDDSWDQLQEDLEGAKPAAYPEVQVLKGMSCFDLGDFYRMTVENILDGISHRYGIS